MTGCYHKPCEDGTVDVDGEISGSWSVNSVASRCAGFRRSMETVDSLPFISNVKCGTNRVLASVRGAVSVELDLRIAGNWIV